MHLAPPGPGRNVADVKSVRAFSWYFLAVFGGGALLAPGLYHLVQWLAPRFPAAQELADAIEELEVEIGG